MKNERINKKTVRLTLTAILAALALALSFFESLLPTFAFLPPGAKLGLSNIVVMFAMSALGLPYAFGIMLLKCCFAGLTRGASAFFISFSGGVLSVITLFLFMRLLKGRFGILGVSVSSAVMHNMGQLVAASLIAGSGLLLGYAPAMLIAGIGAGIITGTAYGVILPYIKIRKV